MKCALVAAVAVLLAVAPRTAAADDDPLALPTSTEALRHFDDGGVYFEKGEYDQAVAEYEKGARLEDLPVWDWNLGLAHQRAGNLERARWYYDRFISRIHAMADVNDYVAAARLHLGEIDAAQPQRDDEQEPTRPPSSPFTTSRKIAIGVGVAGLVAGGFGVALTLRSEGLKDDAAAICPTTACSRADEANQLAADADTSQHRAVIAYGIGAVAIVGAVVVWLIGAPEHTTRASTVAVPHLSPSYAGIDVTMRF